MLERVIENWLDKASERSFQKPFCDILSAKGHTIVHLTRHCGMELGKDVLSIDPDGIPCAYQLKGAGGSRISLKRWNDGLNQQAFNLVVNSISHPSIPSTPHHKAYFVTNGMLDEEVSAAIKQQNEQWANQGMSHLQLRTIVRGELIADAKSLEAGLWPTEIADFKALLEMYLHRGDGPLPKNEFAALLASLVPGHSDPEAAKPSDDECGRVITSAAVLCSLASAGFSERENHFAILEAWTLYAACILSFAARWSLKERLWKPQLTITLQHLHNTLLLLEEDVVAVGSKVEGMGMEDKPFANCRLTLIGAYLAVLDLWPNGDTLEREPAASRFLQSYAKRFEVWGESAIPYYLAAFWSMQRHDASARLELMLRDLTWFVARSNRPDSNSPLASPYYDLGDILPRVAGIERKPIDEAFNGRAFTLEGLVHLVAKRNWKQTMRGMWAEISRVGFASFRPQEAYQFFNWYCGQGLNRTVYPKHTKPWSELWDEAHECCGTEIPEIARAYPYLILLYVLVSPHRISSGVMRWLDQQFSVSA